MRSPAPALERLWPIDSAIRHYQATVFCSTKTAKAAIEAAKALQLRRFYIQLFRAERGVAMTDSLKEASRSSNRLVVIQAGGKRKNSMQSALTAASIPIVRLDVLKPTPEHVMEACLRNLE